MPFKPPFGFNVMGCASGNFGEAVVLMLKGIDNYGLGSIADKDTAQNLLLLAIAMRAITAWGDE